MTQDTAPIPDDKNPAATGLKFNEAGQLVWQFAEGERPITNFEIMYGMGEPARTFPALSAMLHHASRAVSLPRRAPTQTPAEREAILDRDIADSPYPELLDFPHDIKLQLWGMVLKVSPKVLHDTIFMRGEKNVVAAVIMPSGELQLNAGNQLTELDLALIGNLNAAAVRKLFTQLPKE